MKVTILKSTLSSKGGLEKYTKKIIEAFVSRGCDVTVLCAQKDFDNARKEYSIISMPRCSRFTWRRLLQYDAWCQQWIKSNPSDIVFGLERNRRQTHYRAGNGVHAQYLQQRKINAPFYKKWAMLSNPSHQILLQIEKEAYLHPDLRILFTNSNMVRNEILSHYPTVEAKKICVVHNGVEWQQWSNAFRQSLENQAAIQQQLHLHSSCFQFLFVGHGFLRKGLLYLLHGLHALHQKGIKNWQLSIVGHDRKQKMFQEIVKHLQMEQNICFFESQSNMIPFYQAADAIVIPSLYDPFANVTVEALAMGCSVLTSVYNGGKEVLNTNNGLLIENLFDVDSVACALMQMMKRPKKKNVVIETRQSVKHLDFSQQLQILIDKTLASV